MTGLVKSLSLRFHERHYLVILVKKHLTAMYGDDLAALSKEELKERLKLCEEVNIEIHSYRTRALASHARL